MKRVYINEEWCLGCRLCEYWCVWSASGESYFPFAFDGGDKPPAGMQVEDMPNGIHFAVDCRHCEDPLCMKGCISGALYRDEFGAVRTYCSRSLTLQAGGAVELVGPAAVPLCGGMAGCYLRTRGEAGEGRLTVAMEGAQPVTLTFRVAKQEEE